jgi:hypothetical protein
VRREHRARRDRNPIDTAPEEAAKLRDFLAAWRSTHADPTSKAPLSDELSKPAATSSRRRHPERMEHG